MSFEVERFEWTAGDRLEVAGRWFGVRGRRFLRPTLDVKVDGRTERLLATLEHKPWAADEGEEWLAAFAWDDEGADIDGAQLTVGPGLEVELAPPAAATGVRPGPPREGARELAAARAEVKRLRAELERERAALGAEADKLRERLAAAERNAGTQRTEVRGAQQQAASERAAASEAHQALEREREVMRTERDELTAELDLARRERDAANARLGAVQSELEGAERARDKAREERNSWLNRARDAAAERDGALAARDAAAAERDEVAAERDAAFADRNAARAELDGVRSERREARADREAARREREAARRLRTDRAKRLPAQSEARTRDDSPAAQPAVAMRSAPRAAPARPAAATGSVRRIGPIGESEPVTSELPDPPRSAPSRPIRWIAVTAVTLALALVAALVLVFVL